MQLTAWGLLWTNVCDVHMLYLNDYFKRKTICATPWLLCICSLLSPPLAEKLASRRGRKSVYALRKFAPYYYATSTFPLSEELSNQRFYQVSRGFPG